MPETRPGMRLLCLDHEGGHGGSSRSLFTLLSNLSKEELEITVWCKKESHLQYLYEDLGIHVEVLADLPTYAVFSASNIDNLSLLKDRLIEFLTFFSRRKSFLDKIEGNFDLIHYNHVSFAPLAWLIKRSIGLPATMHIRTIPHYSIMAQWQALIVNRAVDRLICITENEKSYMEHFLGSSDSVVVHNAPFPPLTSPLHHPKVPLDNRLRIASLSNFHLLRGVDRIAEVARIIDTKGRGNDVLFVLAGTMNLIKSLPGKLGKIGSRGGTFADYVAEENLSHMFRFLGHVSEPENVIEACHATIKLTRDGNPWGRDIIESLAAGRPVISLGTWDGFIRNGVTGVLFSEYDPVEIAEAILLLKDDPDVLMEMGAKSKAHISVICDPVLAAKKVYGVWRQLTL